MMQLVLPSISYTGLVAQHEDDVNSLLNACRSTGCFYLSLRDVTRSNTGNEVSEMFSKAGEIVENAKAFFDRPLPEKMAWEMDAWGSHHTSGFVQFSGVAATDDPFLHPKTKRPIIDIHPITVASYPHINSATQYIF